MQRDRTELCLLYDLYSGALTEKQDDCFRMHYFMDLSLGEIAEELEITRQAARDTVVRAENTLRKYEQQLGLMQRHSNVAAQIGALISAIEDMRTLNREEIFSSLLDDKLRLLNELIVNLKTEE